MSGISMSQAGLADRIRDKANAARGAGADGLDIRLMLESGMDGQDVMNLRRFTAAEQLLLVVRCPKRNAAAFHGDLPGAVEVFFGPVFASGCDIILRILASPVVPIAPHFAELFADLP